MAMGSGAAEMTMAQLAARGPYMDVQFIWDNTQSANLLFTVPYTDVDGTARVQPVTYINLATLFEITAGGAEDPAVGSAVSVAQESHSGVFTAVAALTAAQAQALKMRSVIWVDADPTGGTGLVGSLVGSPGTWVIVFPAFIGLAAGTLGGHGGGTPTTTGNMGAITAAQLAGVNRLTVNFIDFAGGVAVYTIQGSSNTYVVNLADFITANEIDSACH